jgi:ribosome recycling factor
MVARIKELCEEAKVSIRSIRRDANKAVDTAEKDKAISEDDRDKLKEDIQELTKKYETEATDVAKARENDVMEQS